MIVPVQKRGWISRPRKKKRYPKFKPKVRKISNSWDSEPCWTSLLENDFSIFFDKCFKLYPHYLDTVLDGLEIIKTGQNKEDINGIIDINDGFTSINDGFTDMNGYTAVDTDLFLPKGLYKGEKGVEIIFDSGCTHAVTPHEADFVGRIKPVTKVMNGLGANANITGEGTVIWEFRDDYGVTKRIQVKAYLVPASKVRIFIPQAYFQLERGGQFTMNRKGSVFEFANGGTLTFKYSTSCLPIAQASISNKVVSLSGYLASTSCKNISKAQEELLLWHAIFGHYDINNTQCLMTTVGVDKESLLKTKEPGAGTCSIPLCAACLRGKGGLIPTYSKMSVPDPDHAEVIKDGDLVPGVCVSTDQYECRIKGRLPNTRGKEDPQKIYCGGTLFSDHASSKIEMYHQVSLGATDTVRSKNLYEQEAAEVGVKISSYKGDNGVYKSKEFREDLLARQQTMAYLGVGVHGQNGVAERGISTVVNSARTMMLHQALLWPEHFDMRLWPFALTHAAYIWNILPNRSNGLSPS